MDTRYLIAQRDGRYEAKFETSMGNGPMLAEGLARDVGAQILYKGNFDDIKKASVILDVVKDANKSGEFDAKLLEARLSE